MAPQFLLPLELEAAALRARDEADGAEALAGALEALWALRHSDLLRADSRCYTVPAAVALPLYRHDPQRHRRWAEAVPGPPTAAEFGRRLAAAARDAVAAADGRLLGRLAYLADLGTALGVGAADGLGGLFARHFDLAGGALGAELYLTAAVAYLGALPAGSVPPAELLAGGPGRGDTGVAGWRLLRHFWLGHPGLWKRSPAALDELAQAACPLVRLRGEQLATCDDPAPPNRKPRRARPNLFAAPAAGLGAGALPPPRPGKAEAGGGRFGRVLRAVAGRLRGGG